MAIAATTPMDIVPNFQRQMLGYCNLIPCDSIPLLLFSGGLMKSGLRKFATERN